MPKFKCGDKVIYKDDKIYTICAVIESSHTDLPHAYSLAGTLLVAKEHQLKKV